MVIIIGMIGFFDNDFYIDFMSFIIQYLFIDINYLLQHKCIKTQQTI